jgi:hypothetical protein
MLVQVSSQAGAGSQRGGRVTEQNAQEMAPVIPEILPIGTVNRFRYFNSLCGSTGADSGTTNQRVDGSSTTQEFYVNSDADFDIYIAQIVIFIGDASVTHGGFGAVAALATGWDLMFREQGANISIISKAKTGGEVIIQSGTTLAWGDAATSFELTNFSGNEDATVVSIPISQQVPGGLRIGRGSSTRLRSVVNDDLTGLTQFQVRAIGYRHYP